MQIGLHTFAVYNVFATRWRKAKMQVCLKELLHENVNKYGRWLVDLVDFLPQACLYPSSCALNSVDGGADDEFQVFPHLAPLLCAMQSRRSHQHSQSTQSNKLSFSSPFIHRTNYIYFFTDKIIFKNQPLKVKG